MRKKDESGPVRTPMKEGRGRRQGPEQSRQAHLTRSGEVGRRCVGSWREWEEATVTPKFPVGW